jgi:RNA polymerase sigma factor (sigma-70 family)
MQRPSRVMDREERLAWIRLAMELLEPSDRQILELRDWEERSFVEIAEELGIGESAARMRYQRALPKLAKNVERLRRGQIGRVTGS